MDTIDANIRMLTRSIKRSDEYREYKRWEQALDARPDLWEQVDEFRAHNFRVQNETNIADMYAAIDELNQKLEELRKIPEVNAYLRAELDLCRLLQQISREINGSMNMHIPNL